MVKDWRIRLKRLMKKKGMEQADLSRASGKSIQFINNYLRLERERIGDKDFEALATGVGVTPSELRYGVSPLIDIILMGRITAKVRQAAHKKRVKLTPDQIITVSINLYNKQIKPDSKNTLKGIDLSEFLD